MTVWMVILVAVSLCFDTLAVSAVGGAAVKGRIPTAGILRIVLSFALFQGGFTLLGWALGSALTGFLSAIDHWIAFALLALLGIRMIADSRSGETSATFNLFSPGQLVMASVATSIDALAVGISFAVLGLSRGAVFADSLIIAFVTAVAALAGLLFGGRIGEAFGARCNLAGGVVLIIIGLKILAEHLLL